MKRNISVVSIVGLLACGVAVLLTWACEPWPICQWETCLDVGGICRGYDVWPCAIGMANTCYHRYYCPSRGYVDVWEGDTCCYPCEYP